MNLSNFTIPTFAQDLNCPTCVCPNEFIIGKSVEVALIFSILVHMTLLIFLFTKPGNKKVVLGLGYFFNSIVLILQVIAQLHKVKDEILLILFLVIILLLSITSIFVLVKTYLGKDSDSNLYK